MGCGGSSSEEEQQGGVQDTRSEKPPRHRGADRGSRHSVTSDEGGGGSMPSPNTSRRRREDRQQALDRLIAQLIMQDQIQAQQQEEDQQRHRELEIKEKHRGLSEEELSQVGLVGLVSLKVKAAPSGGGGDCSPSFLHAAHTKSGSVDYDRNSITGEGVGAVASPNSQNGGMRSFPNSCPGSPVFSVCSTSMEGCVMCFEPFSDGNDEVRLLPCGHLFHSQCVDEWLKRRRLCPSCNQDVLQTPGGPTTTARGPGESSTGAGGDDDKAAAEEEADTLDHGPQSTAYGGSKVWTVVPYGAEGARVGEAEEDPSTEQSPMIRGQKKEAPLPPPPSSGEQALHQPPQQQPTESITIEELDSSRPATMTAIDIAVEGGAGGRLDNQQSPQPPSKEADQALSAPVAKRKEQEEEVSEGTNQNTTETVAPIQSESEVPLMETTSTTTEAKDNVQSSNDVNVAGGNAQFSS